MQLLKVILLILPLNLLANNQYKAHSLKIVLDRTTVDSSRVKVLLELSKNADDFLSAIDYAEQAIKLSKGGGYNNLLIDAYFVNGSNLVLLGSYDRALNNFIDAIKLIDPNVDSAVEFKIYNNIGTVYEKVGELTKALEYYIEALKIYQNIAAQKELKSLCMIYNNIGSIYMTLNDFTTAEVYLQKALDHSVLQEDKLVQGNVYNNLGKLYLRQKDHDKALEYLNTSLKIRQSIGDSNEIVKSYFFLTVYYWDIGDDAMALKIGHKALELSDNAGTLEWSRWINKYIYLINRRLKNYDAALHAHEAYKFLSDSINNQKSISEIARLQMQYEYEKKDQLRTAQEQRTRIVYVFVISVLAMSIFIVGLLYVISKSRSKRINLENQQLEQDLDMKNKELTTNVMYLLKKNEFLNTIIGRLLDVKNKLRGDNKQALEQLIFDVESAVDEDIWEEFELRFQQVHDEFFDKLKELSSELTPAELRICAFLRLSMKTKEIAAITHLSIRTIEVTRSNIRKKLNLTHSDTNLIAFLNTL